MAIYNDSKELKAATGADLMLRAAFKFEIENIEEVVEEYFKDFVKPATKKTTLH